MHPKLVLLLHYFTLWNLSVPLAAKLPQSMMLSPPCLRAATVFFKSLTFNANMPLVIVAKYINISSDQKHFSSGHLACPCEQLQISAELVMWILEQGLLYWSAHFQSMVT